MGNNPSCVYAIAIKKLKISQIKMFAASDPKPCARL